MASSRSAAAPPGTRPSRSQRASSRRSSKSSDSSKRRRAQDAERTVEEFLGFHVMGDQPRDAWRHLAGQGLDAGGNVVLRIDRLANVVEQGRQQELLVVRVSN